MLSGNSSNLQELWENFGSQFSNGIFEENPLVPATPSPGIQCMPAPGPFLPCNDLFDWWTLRCSVWIVFLLALLGNGCVVIVLIASRGKMDVPRFLVCNLAMADFCMGLYLGFLAIVDASSLGEFRKMAIHWQYSAGCQVAGFFGVLSSELSVFTLAVITLERNYAITHAMHLNKRLSLKHAAYIMGAGWTFSILMAMMPLFGVSDYRKFAVCLPFETGDPISLGYVVFLMLINGVAFSILMGCYLKMYCAIRGSQAWNSNDSRIAKRMALLVFTDFICWAPIAFLALTASFGLHLISLETAKVFTIFILPLNSCCNPFLYAILTKQFKKDCVMICKTIEESRVTRGIGRCRHSSNFSNRQTPANTNSINSGSGTHGSHGSHSKGTVCSCNVQKASKAPLLATYWPFKKIKKFFHGCKETSDSLVTNSAFTHQIAEIQHKQRKTKRHASVSSDNFSSSRSDSWRHGIPGLHNDRHYRHRRRNSWTVTRKPSQDSQMSSSRNDSASSNSTNTWRMSRSSVSSEMSNSIGRVGSGRHHHVGLFNSSESSSGSSKFTQLAYARARAMNHPPGVLKPYKAPPLSRLASENASLMSSYGGGKPKLIRQSAILADGDSTSSGKSVTFKEPAGVGSARRFVAATAELGQCPLHSRSNNAQPFRNTNIYGKLAELSQEEEEVEEESDMEASDAEDDEPVSEGLPMGATFRTTLPKRPSRLSNLIPRKLSSLSSGKSEKVERPEEEVNETTPLRNDQQTAAQVLGDSQQKSEDNHSPEELPPDVEASAMLEMTKTSSSEDDTVIGASSPAAATAAELVEERMSQTQQLKKKFLESDI